MTLAQQCATIVNPANIMTRPAFQLAKIVKPGDLWASTKHWNAKIVVYIAHNRRKVKQFAFYATRHHISRKQVRRNALPAAAMTCPTTLTKPVVVSYLARPVSIIKTGLACNARNCTSRPLDTLARHAHCFKKARSLTEPV